MNQHDKEMREPLLPCPFCGSEARKHKHVDSCACSKDTCWLYTVYIAFDDWNTRATTRYEAALREAREALEKLRDDIWDDAVCDKALTTINEILEKK